MTSMVGKIKPLTEYRNRDLGRRARGTKYNKCGISTAPPTPIVTSDALHNGQSYAAATRNFQQFFECLSMQLFLEIRG